MQDTPFISRYQKLERLLALYQVNEHLYSTDLMDKQRIFETLPKNPHIAKAISKFDVLESDMPKLLFLKRILEERGDIIKRISLNYFSYSSLDHMLESVIYVSHYRVDFYKYYNDLTTFCAALDFLNIKYSIVNSRILVEIPDFKMSELLGVNAWCISRSEKFWNYYTQNNRQMYFFFSIDKHNKIYDPFAITSSETDIHFAANGNNSSTPIDRVAIEALTAHTTVFNFNTRKFSDKYLSINLLSLLVGIFLFWTPMQPFLESLLRSSSTSVNTFYGLPYMFFILGSSFYSISKLDARYLKLKKRYYIYHIFPFINTVLFFVYGV